MKHFILIAICLGITFHVTALTSFGDGDGDITLTPPPPPKPEIFGIRFDDTPRQITETLIEAGLPLESQESQGPHKLIKSFVFSGIPEGLTIREGQIKLLFFKNQLTRIDLLFPPSYQNFLILRSQLFQSMENRFRLNTKQESMDRHLQARLANLKKGEFDSKAEEAVKQSILNGKTFFFYSIQDNRNELNVSYSFAVNRSPDPHPQLLLHYSLKTRMDEMQAYHTKQKTEILPERG